SAEEPPRLPTRDPLRRVRRRPRRTDSGRPGDAARPASWERRRRAETRRRPPPWARPVWGVRRRARTRSPPDARRFSFRLARFERLEGAGCSQPEQPKDEDRSPREKWVRLEDSLPK